MTTVDDVHVFLDEVRARIDHGAQDYGDQSFMRPVQSTVAAMLCEQADIAGWLYVLWCQAARKTDWTREQTTLRDAFVAAIEHRIRRNDRRTSHDVGAGPRSCMHDLEVLAVDLFEQRTQLRRRLLPIARAIEVAQYLTINENRGRRGGAPDPRSSD